jgi:hypothetical protein
MEKELNNKIGVSFKIHNTWGFLKTWLDGGKENYNDKLLKGIKTFLKDGTDLGRIKKSYVNDDWFCYETTNNTIKVSVRFGGNFNRGTWISIDEIKVK